MSTNLINFINQGIEERGWSLRELGRRAEMSHSTISGILSEQYKPGPDFCNGIARAFKEPPERIFRIAGILPPVVIGQEREKQLLDYFRSLDVSDQDHVITIVKTFYVQRTSDESK